MTRCGELSTVLSRKVSIFPVLAKKQLVTWPQIGPKQIRISVQVDAPQTRYTFRYFPGIISITIFISDPVFSSTLVIVAMELPPPNFLSSDEGENGSHLVNAGYDPTLASGSNGQGQAGSSSQGSSGSLGIQPLQLTSDQENLIKSTLNDGNFSSDGSVELSRLFSLWSEEP